MTTQRRRKLLNKGKARQHVPVEYKVAPKPRPELFMVHAPEPDNDLPVSVLRTVLSKIASFLLCRG